MVASRTQLEISGVAVGQWRQLAHEIKVTCLILGMYYSITDANKHGPVWLYLKPVVIRQKCNSPTLAAMFNLLQFLVCRARHQSYRRIESLLTWSNGSQSHPDVSYFEPAECTGKLPKCARCRYTNAIFNCRSHDLKHGSLFTQGVLYRSFNLYWQLMRGFPNTDPILPRKLVDLYRLQCGIRQCACPSGIPLQKILCGM